MRRLILGTDWWTDCDDAVALRLLARYVKAGRVALGGIAINACMPDSVASLRGFLRAEGLPADLPLGLDRAATDYGGHPSYQRRLAARFGADISNAEAEDALRLYRRLLAEAQGPVEIVEIGYPQVLAALLESAGDDLSPLGGEALMREKVAKCWVMAGKWDEDGGRENNFCRSPRASRAAAVFCERCPVPVTFLGWEVGSTVISGGHLPQGDHLRDVLADHGSPAGRFSWDPMLMLLCLVGDEEAAGYRVVRGRATVEAESGANHFTPSPNGRHAYMVKTKSDEEYAAAIDALL